MGPGFLGLESQIPIGAQFSAELSQMRKCDGEPNNETGLYIPYRARLAHTLRTPVASPSLNNSRIAPAGPIRTYILII
jgi:hypothetical protein